MKGSWAGRDGADAVHAVELPRARAGLRRRRPPRHLETLPDVFASIANYMMAYGWNDEQTWGREVKVPPGGATKLAASVGFRAERLPRGARADRADAAGEMAVAGRADGGRRRRCRKSIGRRRCCAPARSPTWSTAITTRCSATTARTPTRWPWACFPTASTKIRSWAQPNRSAALVTAVLSLAALSMAGGRVFRRHRTTAAGDDRRRPVRHSRRRSASSWRAASA